MTRAVTFLREHQRWLIVGLLFFVAMVNNLDRQTLSVLAPTLRREMGFGPVEYSYITSAFLAAYGIGYAFCGRVLDRIGVKLGLALALAFWSLAGAGHAMAVGWVSLAVFRFLLGLWRELQQPGRREGDCGVDSAARARVVHGGVLERQCYRRHHRAAAGVVPRAALRLAVGVHRHGRGRLRAARDLVAHLRRAGKTRATRRRGTRVHPGGAHPAGGPADGEAVDVGAPFPAALPRILRRPAADGPDLVFLSFWLPDYLTHARGFTLAMIGLIGWLPFLASPIGGPGGGALSDWLVRRGWPAQKARRTLMLVAACLMPLAAVAVRIDAAWIAIALIAVLLGAQSCWMANQLTLISESVSRKTSGR